MANASLRRRLAADESLACRPDAALVDVLKIPEKFVSPGQRILRRLVYAMLALLAAAVIVYLDRGGYRDVKNQPLSLLDASITQPSRCPPRATATSRPHGAARLTNVFVITPLRFIFLIVLIGTTVEVLTTQSRQAAISGDGGTA